MNQKIISQSLAELLGAMAIVLFGCGTIAVIETFQQRQLAPFVPIVFGSTVGLMIYSMGHISGGHFNPAVTLALASVKRFPWKKVPYYLGAQFFGGALGSFLISLFVQGTQTYGATVPQVGTLPSFGVELILTFFLMLTITSVATDKRAPSSMAGAAVGATIMICAFMGGPLTGASMNPARSLGPAIFQQEYTGLWIYFLAPILGAIMAASLYELIRSQSQTELAPQSQ